jgi:hypothetical protein
VFSSRKIERRLHEDLAFRMPGAGNFPKHRTIRDLRSRHLMELSDLFVQVVKLAREAGPVKLGTVAIDGTKIKANASRHKATSYERMQQAQGELKAQDNFTDPESRIMKRSGGGFDASYNAQTAVDETAHIIVAVKVGRRCRGASAGGVRPDSRAGSRCAPPRLRMPEPPCHRGAPAAEPA